MNPQIESTIDQTIAQLSPELRSISLQIHNHPELGNQEFHAYKVLTRFLENQGFQVTHGAAGLSTAFIAEYSNGPGRRVGFCSEYDALPGIGHGCGHNLIAIAGVACAMAVKALLDQGQIEGTVVLFGTPAEESTSGKITLVAAKEVQNRADMVMMLHPTPSHGVYGLSLALDWLKVEFFGRAAHAGASPWEGINAVDALMQAWDNIAMLRQQTLPSNRIHGIITDGGKSANVIPDYASASFYVRSVTRKQLVDLKQKVENCFKAAALATGCKIELSWAPYGAIDDIFTNEPLAERYKEYMGKEGVKFPSRSEEESSLFSASSDFGNISNVVPGIQPGFDILTKAPNHTIEFTNAAATPEAHAQTLQAARSLSKTAAAVFLDPSLYDEAHQYFKKGKQE